MEQPSFHETLHSHSRVPDRCCFLKHHGIIHECLINAISSNTVVVWTEDGFSTLWSRWMVTEGDETHLAFSSEVRTGVPARFCRYVQTQHCSFPTRSNLFPPNPSKQKVLQPLLRPYLITEVPFYTTVAFTISLWLSMRNCKRELDINFVFPLAEFAGNPSSQSRV